MCRDIDLVVDCYQDSTGGYGKGLMKQHKCGPDAWIQLALQLAYFRDQVHAPCPPAPALARLSRNEGMLREERGDGGQGSEMAP